MSLSVVFVYGSLVWGLFPGKVGMSWEGHLSGFIVGFVLAIVYKTKNIAQPKYEWEKNDYNSEDDEFMQLFDEDGNFNPNDNDEAEDEKHSQSEIVYHIKNNDKKNH